MGAQTMVKQVYLVLDGTGFPIDAFDKLSDALQRADKHNTMLPTKELAWCVMSLLVNPGSKCQVMAQSSDLLPYT
jgi:hypothetical protein